jgi:DNA-binding transcriptional LysR family regulator
MMFNDPLFERCAQGLKPTPRLTLLASQLHQVLQQLEQLTRPTVFDPAIDKRCFAIHLLETAYALNFPFFMPTLLNQVANIRLSA